MSRELTALARLLLWDYERGSLAYDLMWLLILGVVASAPLWVGDPMVR